MSTTRKSTSDPQGDGSTSRSVFDFLYNDSRRVGSFLAQFEVGHLQQVTQSNEATEQNTEASGRQFALGAPKVLGGASNSSESNIAGTKDTSQRVYDPYWSNARAFLDYLSSRDMIETNIHAAAMGRFVLITGALVLLDLATLKPLWQLPAIQKLILSGIQNDEEESPGGNRQLRRAAPKPRPRKLADLAPEIQAAIEFLPHVPHSSQANLLAEDFTAWCTLDSSSMVGTPTDLAMKHGAKVAGEWTILGILDARPDEAGDELTVVDRVQLGMFGSAIVRNAAIEFAPVTRQLVGRPAEAFGITPLLIFREVAG